MSKNVRCSECRHQMTGWDGGFFGLPFTCECRVYGETEGRKSCSEFKKRVTKSDLLNKIHSLENTILSLENEVTRQNNQIKLLQKQLWKIPPKIREVWLND